MRIIDVINYLHSENIDFIHSGIEEKEIDGYSSLFNYRNGTMTFVAPERHFVDYEKDFVGKKLRLVIVSFEEKDNPCFESIIHVNDPRAVFFDIIDGLLDKPADSDVTGISSDPNVYSVNSYIAPTAKIGKNVRIGVGCVIEGNTEIGDDTEIHHNVIIRNKTKIGKNCMIHSGVIIGEYGFGYIINENGEKVMLRHYGGVTIEDNVHIGDNSIIIRGAIDDTIIHKGVKLNTLVHIAHNDDIGENTIITSPCHVCGSVQIGRNAHIAGTTIRNQRNVGDDAIVGLGAVVVKNVEPGTTVVGNPAIEMVKK